jgi:hypothetical protein
MAKEWSDEEVQNEIKEAIAIVREDRFEKFARSRIAPVDPAKSNAPPSGGTNEDPNAGAPKKSKSIFWGEIDD